MPRSSNQPTLHTIYRIRRIPARAWSLAVSLTLLYCTQDCTYRVHRVLGCTGTCATTHRSNHGLVDRMSLRRIKAAGQRQSSRWFSSSHFGSEIQALAQGLPHVSCPSSHSSAAALRSDIAQDTPCPSRDEARTPCFAWEALFFTPVFPPSLRKYLLTYLHT